MFYFSYNQQNSSKTTYMESVSKVINSLYTKYANFIVIHNFNATEAIWHI